MQNLAPRQKACVHGEEARDPFIHAAAIDAGPKMASFDLARPFRGAGGY
jgi:hypothetical protein